MTPTAWLFVAKKPKIGDKFGRLFIWSILPRQKHGPRALCICDCGKKHTVLICNLMREYKNTRSCGCWHDESSALRKLRHGLTGQKVHRSWAGMRGRCLTKTNKKYGDYGGRGITICARWSSFEAFYADMGEPPSKYHTLGRINNDGNYRPSNCRWETAHQQINNRRTTRKLLIDGKNIPLADVARKYNINYKALWARVKAKRPMGEILGLNKSSILGKNQWTKKS